MKLSFRYPLRSLAICSLAAWFSTGAQAEWSDDPAANFIVADNAGGTTQPHMAPTPDGGFYVSWFSSADQYDIHLQRLDADGNEMWPHGGVLVADRSYGFTYDYGLAVDAAGNAYVSFNCCLNNSPTEHVVISKVLADGTLAWGANGVTVSAAGTEQIYNAFVTVASDGNAVVAWTADSGVRAQKLDSTGAILWTANGVLLNQPSGLKLLADIEPALNGDVIVSWSNQGGGNVLRAQKLASASGAPLWGGGTAVRVFGQGNLQNGYFPTFTPDGAGGAVFSDYDIIGVSTFNARVQHIDANGNALLDPNGVLATTDAVNLHTGTVAAYDPMSNSIYAVWRENFTDNSGHTFDGVSAQRIDSSGQRMWGNTGKVIVALTDSTDSTNSISQLTAVPAAGDVIATWTTGAVPAPNQPISAVRLDAAGTEVWPTQIVAVKTLNATSRTVASVSTQGFAAYAWEDGDELSGSSTIRAQNLHFDGTLGVPSSVPDNDAWSARTAIATVTPGSPFTTTETNAALATADPTDPTSPCVSTTSGVAGVGANSLWYSYTTGSTPEYVNLSTQGTYYYSGVNPVTHLLTTTPTIISVYTGQPGSFQLVGGGCNQTVAASGSYSLVGGLRLEPNTTYSIAVTAANALSTVDPPPAPATSMPTLAFSLSSAPVYNVDRVDDPLPAAATCSAGNCSIRAAVNAVNAAPGAIVIPAGTYTMTATTTNDDANADGDFDVGTSASIYGAGRGQTIIDAPVNDRVFDFISAQGVSGSGQTNLVADLSLVGPGDPASGGSGAYTFGGALVRSRSTSFQNFTAFERVELAHAYTTNLGDSGTFQAGGAAQLAAHGQIIDSDIHDNTGRNGGGVALLTGAAPFEIRGTSIHGNVATNTTASTSSATNGGGGLLIAAAATVIDSTIANNRSNSDGGGIATGNIGSPALAKMQIRSTTIAGNIADADGDAVGAGGGLRVARTAGVNVYNDIFYGNTTGTAATADDCTGATPTGTSPTLTGYNLVGAFSGAACAFDAVNNHDLVGANPLLGALADNGGPTSTLALGAGSPALDAGDPAGCADSTGTVLTFDQRGFARVAGLRCDIGAFELASTLPTPETPVLDAASDSGLSNSDDLTNVVSPLIEGTCESSPDYVVDLVVDGAVAGTANCVSAPYQSVIGPLVDGMHQVAVYAVDQGGAPTAQSPSLTLTIDTQTSVNVDSGPSDPSTSPDAMFVVSAEDGDVLTCTLDAGTPATCTSPVTYGGLGGGSHSFNVDASDAAGNHATGSWSWTIIAPAAPSVPVLDPASDSGASNSDGITNATAPIFHGTCEQDGDLVQLMDSGTPIGSAAACASGAYTATASSIAEGTHAISAVANRGGVLSTASGAATIVIDRTAPAAPVVTAPIPPAAPPFTMVGTAEANAIVSITQSGNAVCTATADNGGNWTCAITVSGNHLVFSLTATDVAGNISVVATWTDDVAPAAPGTPALDAASDSGSSNADGITNAQTLIFHGTCAADGDLIQLMDGATAAGSPATCAAGAYTAQIANPSEGSHAISAIASRNGVQSTQSAPTTIVIDRTAPAMPVVTGPTPPVPPDFTLTGTAEAAAAIAVTQNGNPVCTTAADGSGNWSCAITTSGAGTLQYSIIATDVAGNASAPASWNAGIDELFKDGFDG